jgi:hypothetical protein
MGSLGTYRGWKIKRIQKGVAKGLLYAERGKGRNKVGFGIIGGDNTIKHLKKEIDAKMRGLK